MKEGDIFGWGGVKTYSDPSYIFSGSRPRMYALEQIVTSDNDNDTQIVKHYRHLYSEFDGLASLNCSEKRKSMKKVECHRLEHIPPPVLPMSTKLLPLSKHRITLILLRRVWGPQLAVTVTLP